MRTNFFEACEVKPNSHLTFLFFTLGFSVSLLAQEKTVPKSITIHQEIDFAVSAKKVYEALLDSKQFALFSGRTAEIDPAVEGTFSLFEKHIIGRNLELVPNERIVQAWRVVDWPAGVYSIARFEIKSRGNGSRLIFDHTGFPEELQQHLAEGWQKNYWDLLTKYFK
jgi:activator of HSP90 ATPase